jgi:hypothetical protein
MDAARLLDLYEECIDNFSSLGLERMKLLGSLCEKAVSELDDSVSGIDLIKVKEELTGVMDDIAEEELQAVEEENASNEAVDEENATDDPIAVKEEAEFDEENAANEAVDEKNAANEAVGEENTAKEAVDNAVKEENAEGEAVELGIEDAVEEVVYLEEPQALEQSTESATLESAGLQILKTQVKVNRQYNVSNPTRECQLECNSCFRTIFFHNPIVWQGLQQ